ncbi:hypothetical protein BHE90_000812 [Fusarium euwallaceae]|uniref:Xylanolytic transcriptional activator regulatory domain-containing protein n=1 Tax=Fusarium euwallaceae TaxID=1147111 RepID=A0A430M9M4_9HYPO|nr:hypothetical protein BHE90_000812 [Fusarium euwallaceae]
MGDACKFFASRAKIYQDLELQTPTIATLQALVLLCEHEAAQGRDSQGWIYSGIATRILSDLGLQLHGTSPDETKSCGADVADVKARVFWSVVHLDTYHDREAPQDSLSKFAVHADASLREWTASLPQSLQLAPAQTDRSLDPVVLQLHLLYHEILILLHRPLIGSSSRAINDQVGKPHSGEHPHDDRVDTNISKCTPGFGGSHQFAARMAEL